MNGHIHLDDMTAEERIHALCSARLTNPRHRAYRDYASARLGDRVREHALLVDRARWQREFWGKR